MESPKAGSTNCNQTADVAKSRLAAIAMRPSLFPIRLIVVALTLAGASALTLAQVDPSTCGDFRSNLQWDYRTATPNEHREVEKPHFPPKVENLIAGNTAPLGADLHYTLGASPNHHRALISITRWSARMKSTNLPYLLFPVECYFVRGMNFKPDDYVVRLLYAQFLILWARPADAAKQLEYVAKMVSDNPFTMYNIGLIYFDMKDYAQALAYGHKAMSMGFFKPELRQQLESVGRWTEPGIETTITPTSTTSVVAPAPAASAAAQNNN